MDHATDEVLHELIRRNLETLEQMIDYNIENDIAFQNQFRFNPFRIKPRQQTGVVDSFRVSTCNDRKEN